MSEWKRIFLNRIWLGTAALSLLFSLVIYATAQSSRVGSSVLAYREHTNQWTQILSVVSPEDGLALLERENQTLQGWNTARMLVQLEEWQGQIDEEILNRYREQYENLDEMLHAVRSETAPELDIAVQESVARWIDRIVYQMGYAEFVQSVSTQAAAIRRSPMFSDSNTFVYPQMTATEFLYYMGKLKGLPSKVLKQRTEHLLTEVDLSTSANQKLGHFSCGMRQRALLAQAMLGNPPLLILDEPTAGVDPYERVRIRSLIARVAQNHIVLLATHIVSDIECIANQVLLMNKGNLLKAGTAAELISSIESKVAQRLCTEEEAEAYQQQYGLGLLLQQQAGQLLRLVGDQLPAEFEPASGISLEEVYLYYCSSDSII